MPSRKIWSYFTKWKQNWNARVEWKHNAWHQILFSLYLLSTTLWTIVGGIHNPAYILNMASSTAIGCAAFFIALLFYSMRLKDTLVILLFAFFLSIALYFGGQSVLLYIYRQDYANTTLSLLITLLKLPLAITAVLLGVYIWRGKAKE